MYRPPLPKCRCGKLLCPDLATAREVRAKIWATHGGNPDTRYYRCRSGGWHWTRQLEPTQ